MPYKDPAKRLEACRRRYAANREQFLAYNAAWRAANPEKFKASMAASRARNKPKIARQNKKWRDAHAAEVRASKKIYAQTHREHVRKKNRDWHRSHKECGKAADHRHHLRMETDPTYKTHVITRRRAWKNRKYATDPQYCVLARLRSRLTKMLRTHGIRKSARTQELIGCTIQELMAHLESLFLSGMTWANRALWHIDHRIPCAKFNLTDPEQQRRCFHFSNLQPLWGPDNLRKGSKSPEEWALTA